MTSDKSTPLSNHPDIPSDNRPSIVHMEYTGSKNPLWTGGIMDFSMLKKNTSMKVLRQYQVRLQRRRDLSNSRWRFVNEAIKQFELGGDATAQRGAWEKAEGRGIGRSKEGRKRRLFTTDAYQFAPWLAINANEETYGLMLTKGELRKLNDRLLEVSKTDREDLEMINTIIESREGSENNE